MKLLESKISANQMHVEIKVSELRKKLRSLYMYIVSLLRPSVIVVHIIM